MGRPKVLVADDQPHVQRLVAATLGDVYELFAAHDGETALTIVQQTRPDLLLLDVNMPRLDGFEVCKRIKAEPATANIPVIMLTAMRDEESRIRGSLAGADAYFVKPFSPLALLAAVQELLSVTGAEPAIAPAPPTLLAPRAEPAGVPSSIVTTLTQNTSHDGTLTITGTEAHQLLAYARDLNASLAEARRLYDELQGSYLATVKSLAAAIDARDPYTGGHVERVADFAVTLGRELGWDGSRLNLLEMGAALHDVGKIGVPDAILRKPGRLTDEEWGMMRLHPEIGARLLETISFLQGSLGCVLRHHERYDGLGYPGGLVGEAIPLEARVVSVADCFDAMVTTRPYRKALPCEQALHEIQHGRGTQFDPTVVDAFERAYPSLLVRVQTAASSPLSPM